MRLQNSTASSRKRRAKASWLNLAFVGLLMAPVCLYLITVVFAAPGDLDTTFAGTGKVRVGFGFPNGHGNSLAMQTDGMLVVAGSVCDKFDVSHLCEFALMR